jgi:DNA-binding NtrC family response regulator
VGSAKKVDYALDDPDLFGLTRLFLVSIGAQCDPDLVISRLTALLEKGINITWYFHYDQYDWMRERLKDQPLFRAVIKPKGKKYVTEIVAGDLGVSNDFVRGLLEDEKIYQDNKVNFKNLTDRVIYIERASKAYLEIGDPQVYPEAIRFLASGEKLDGRQIIRVNQIKIMGNRILLGKSEKMKELRERIKQIGGDPYMHVLITGASGTGKETVAWMIHGQSSRADKKFIAVSCANMNENLIESELFGHTKGSFTGAINDKKGKFMDAEGGTLFLDEIGEMPIELQSRLLRVLQENRITPIGSTDSTSVDVRVIAATNRDLKNAVLEKKFREDLYYRIAQTVIRTPSLSEIPQDIPLFANSILYRYFEERHIEPDKRSEIPLRAMEKLCSYSWPGNVRQLETVIKNAAMQNRWDSIESLIEELSPVLPARSASLSDEDMLLETFTSKYVKLVYNRNGQNKTKACDILGISINTLKKYLDMN